MNCVTICINRLYLVLNKINSTQMNSSLLLDVARVCSSLGISSGSVSDKRISHLNNNQSTGLAHLAQKPV